MSLKQKLSVKQSKVIKHLRHQKKFFLCVYKMDTFALFTAKAWIKNGAEATEYGGEIWINQGHQEKLGLSNIYDKTQDYPDECKKMRCKIQGSGKYHPCRMFIENCFGSGHNNEFCKNTSSYF